MSARAKKKLEMTEDYRQKMAEEREKMSVLFSSREGGYRHPAYKNAISKEEDATDLVPFVSMNRLGTQKKPMDSTVRNCMQIALERYEEELTGKKFEK